MVKSAKEGLAEKRYVDVPGVNEFAALHCGDARLSRYEMSFLHDMLLRTRPGRTEHLSTKQARLFLRIRDTLCTPRLDPMPFIEALSNFDAAMDAMSSTLILSDVEIEKMRKITHEALTYPPASGVFPHTYDGP